MAMSSEPQVAESPAAAATKALVARAILIVRHVAPVLASVVVVGMKGYRLARQGKWNDVALYEILVWAVFSLLLSAMFRVATDFRTLFHARDPKGLWGLLHLIGEICVLVVAAFVLGGVASDTAEPTTLDRLFVSVAYVAFFIYIIIGSLFRTP